MSFLLFVVCVVRYLFYDFLLGGVRFMSHVVLLCFVRVCCCMLLYGVAVCWRPLVRFMWCLLVLRVCVVLYVFCCVLPFRFLLL